MVRPTFNYEQAFWQQGLAIVAGVDEVGRGAWAGPVVAGAAVFSPTFIPEQAPPIRDSKTLSPKQRQIAAQYLQQSELCWLAVGQASVLEINQLGIAPATFLAMSRAIDTLPQTAQAVLIDAFTHPTILVPQQAIIKGDAHSLSIAAASIVAKVFRDDVMTRLSEKFPEYYLAQHKGYGTKTHQQAIERYGLSPIHRTGFQLKFLDEQA